MAILAISKTEKVLGGTGAVVILGDRMTLSKMRIVYYMYFLKKESTNIVLKTWLNITKA